MMKFKKGDRVFVYDNFDATITDTLRSADGNGYIYQCTYADNSSEWVSEQYLTLIKFKVGDNVTSYYGNGKVVEVGRHIIQVSYGILTAPHFESELKPSIPEKKSFWKRIFA